MDKSINGHQARKQPPIGQRLEARRTLAPFRRCAAPGDRVFLPLERTLYRLGGIDERREQPWTVYAVSLLHHDRLSRRKARPASDERTLAQAVFGFARSCLTICVDLGRDASGVVATPSAAKLRSHALRTCDVPFLFVCGEGLLERCSCAFRIA
jgi:hypothetical protein